MGLRFIIGYEQGTENYPELEHVVLWDSVTETAFGHTIKSVGSLSNIEVARRFLDWCEHQRGVKDGDVRALTSAQTCQLQDEFWDEVLKHLQ